MKASAKKIAAAKAKKRLMIVDDHPMTRGGLVHLINDQPDVLIACEAETAAQATQCVLSTELDLVIADITLPDKSGLELIKDIKALRPNLQVLVLSMHDESLYAERALRAGARGYLMKHEGGEKVLEAIRQILSGHIYVSGKMSERILEIFSGGQAATQQRSGIEQLSDREFEVFQLIGTGLATDEIGKRLHMSPKTVEAHRVNIKDKLGLKTAAELISYAARWSASQAAASSQDGS